MHLSDFDYSLPLHLIAQEPALKRDQSRLLIMDKKTGDLTHTKFKKITNYFQNGDVLVINESRVFKARLLGSKPTGGKIEIFLLKKLSSAKNLKIWECLARGKGLTDGIEIIFTPNFTATILQSLQNGLFKIEFNLNNQNFWQTIEKIGQTPLPPYIKTQKDFKKRYQTIYSNQTTPGSVAAPTAGLHFTNQILKQLSQKGVIIAPLTLNVGLGTFAPVKTENISQHKMHSEFVSIPISTAKIILKAKQEKRRVIATGTTSLRAMEGILAQAIKNNKINNALLNGETNIFIKPGFKFKIVDALITNFHTPRSTLLMLVSAFGGYKNIKKAYQEAIKQEYRFFSFGDAMLIK